MNYNYYIGVDVSKLSLDFTILKGEHLVLHHKIGNSTNEIKGWLKEIRKTHKAGGRNTLFCIENSGTYTTILINLLTQRKAAVWLESPLQIHKTLGIQRGKNDKVDSYRIAQYAYTHRSKAKVWSQPREIIAHLKQLRSLRERLLTVKNQLNSQPREIVGFSKRNISKNVAQLCQHSLIAIKCDLGEVTKRIQTLINNDEKLRPIYQWLCSVAGIGKVLAVEMIITTNEFKDFSSPKKYACYCGVAPFKYTSGTSVTSRARVSKIANRRMKTLLHMAAMAAVCADGDCKIYYERRVKEGLNKMSILNAVRNKIISRAFAVVRENRFYEDQKAAKSTSPSADLTATTDSGS